MNTSSTFPFKKSVFIFAFSMIAVFAFGGCGDHEHDHGEGGHSHDDHEHDHGAEQHGSHDDHDDHSDHDDHDDHDDHGHDSGEAEPVVVTQYTENSELFMEHPPLVRGEPARLIVHLTRLSDFTPITEGSLEVRMIPSSGKTYSMLAKAPARDGLFLPEITLPFTGTATMELVLRSPQMDTVHRLESVPVYASADDVPHAHHEEESANLISFSKEQQWRIDFATAPAIADVLHPAVPAFGTLRLPPSGKAIVPAPAEGLVSLGDSLSTVEVGQTVSEKAVLFSIQPDASWSEGLANLREEYLLARLERERVQALFEKEAVAQKRVEEATIKLRTLADALQRLGVDLQSIDDTEFRALAVAPMNGNLAEIFVNPGQRVAPGDPLALIMDASRLVLEATVPVTRLENFPRASDAIFHLDNSSRSIRISELGGTVVSSKAQPADKPGFARFLFQFNNPDERLIPGSKVTVHLIGQSSQETVIIPVEAVNEEQGQPVVYVHTEGETVEKRYPRLGATDGRQYAVVSGIAEGERVVTRGATQIRLSSMSTTEMGHGHAH